MAEYQTDWREYLDPAYYDVPLHAINHTAIANIALYLDKRNTILHNNMMPNFVGCAELAGFYNLEIEKMDRAESPTKQFFKDWTSRPKLNPTVGRFIEILAQLGREDVLTDCQHMIAADVKRFLERPQEFNKMETAPIQDQTVSPGPGFEESVLITRQDVMNNRVTLYDAFVCYNPMGNSSQDLVFIKELIQRFEGPDYKFTLFVPYRDDLPGLNNHSINAKIISERCRHTIVVLSRNFLASPACDFQSTFAHALSPGARDKRIIPIKIQDCQTPNVLRIMACCDFTKKDLWDWSWDRLAKSILIQPSPGDYQVSWSSSLDGLIRTSNFDFNTALDSGLDSTILDSPSTSRSASPATSLRQSTTQPVATRTLEMEMENIRKPCKSNVTVPLAQTQQKPASPIEHFRTFISKKSKTRSVARDS